MDWFFRRFFSRTSEEVPEEEVKQPLPQETTFDTGELDLEEKTIPLGVNSPQIDGVTQPLNPEVVSVYQNEHFAFGQSTDVGLVRNNNQDSALSFFFEGKSKSNHPDMGLFIVADGMGGHHDGEKASAIVTRVLASIITKNVYLPLLNRSDNSLQNPINETLISAVQQANFEVMRHVPEGGTTVTGAVLIGDLVHIVHVGDSRAYLINQDRIEQLTRDHSLVQRLIELEHLTKQEAENHPQKNVLYRAIGQSEALDVDTLTRRMPNNSRLLLCSDGLWGLVEEHELFEIVMNHHNPQDACDKLVSLANTRGGADNITAILLKAF